MNQRQKCCTQCPGNCTSSTRDLQEDHTCCLPTYVGGNLKLSSLKKLNPLDAERNERLRRKFSNFKQHNNERPSSCYDRFAIAKKFHAENLHHQPLPDRVDDKIFRNFRTTLNVKNPRDDNEKRSSSESILHRDSRYTRLSRDNNPADHRYGPILGCKVPTTNMDLAICWEAPLDRIYEPERAIHIDGTDGGPAPAIFALVDHEIPNRVNHRQDGKCMKNNALDSYEAKFNNVRNRCRCNDDNNDNNDDDNDQTIDRRISRISKMNDEFLDNSNFHDATRKCCEHNLELKTENEKKHSLSLDKELCEDLESFHISNEQQQDESSLRSVIVPRRGKLQPLHLRNCTSCECRGERGARKPRQQRLTQSAHGGMRNFRRNGLPTKLNVPRPRTPYAKRSFCIDTLTPPFSIVNGCRDADYPEHWRLTSVYQQSYRNPLKQRGTILNYN